MARLPPATRGQTQLVRAPPAAPSIAAYAAPASLVWLDPPPVRRWFPAQIVDPSLPRDTCPPMDSLLVDWKIEVSNLVSLICRDDGYTEVVSKLLLVSPVFILLRSFRPYKSAWTQCGWYGFPVSHWKTEASKLLSLICDTLKRLENCCLYRLSSCFAPPKLAWAQSGPFGFPIPHWRTEASELWSLFSDRLRWSKISCLYRLNPCSALIE